MDHMWAILVKTLRKKSKEPATGSELLYHLHQICSKIPQPTISELVNDMPKRIANLKAAKGQSSTYQ